MQTYQKLLLNNKAWAAQQLENDPDYFVNLSKDQNPNYLWIGCSDSRVPADKITGTQPGEIFVHRNVANMVVHTDMNLMSVLQYAVEVLNVKHILVVGHYNCGGIKAAMTNDNYGIINKWLRNIKDIYEKYQIELQSIEDTQLKSDRLVELNVIEQVKNLAKTTIVQKSWNRGQYPYIHGWVMDLHSGHINQIIEVESGDLSVLNPVHRYNFPKP